MSSSRNPYVTSRRWAVLATTVIALAAAPASLSPLLAQMPGTIFGQVFDEKEEPIEGVTITITDPERPDFKQVETTDKRGRFRIHIANATVPYEFAISKSGYQTNKVGGVKVPARQEVRKNFTLRSDEAALTAAQEAGDIDPNALKHGEAVGIYNQGVAALRAGDKDTAVAMFQSAIEKKADFGEAFAALARIYLEKGDHQRALDNALKAVKLNADVDSMQQVLYNSYTALGDKDKAAEALQKLAAADPQKASKNLFNQAVDLYNNGKMEEAKAGFEQVLQTDPNNAKAHYLLGLVYINESENAKAKEHLEKFLQLAPNDEDAGTAKEMLQYLKP